MDTRTIASRLVALCREGRFEAAYDELFAEDARNVEMPAVGDGPLGDASGLAAIRRKAAAWRDGVEVHGLRVGDPCVAGNWFCVPMSLDVTYAGRPRTQVDELCVYQVRDGKIVLEQFFYDT